MITVFSLGFQETYWTIVFEVLKYRKFPKTKSQSYFRHFLRYFMKLWNDTFRLPYCHPIWDWRRQSEAEMDQMTIDR